MKKNKPKNAVYFIKSSFNGKQKACACVGKEIRKVLFN